MKAAAKLTLIGIALLTLVLAAGGFELGRR